MANGEWLTQLMAGLGGAFTGATQARSRMAEEQEAQRKKMELENERARLKRIQELRGSPLTEASRSELFRLGETPGNIAALQEMSTPEKPKAPSYTQRMVGPGRRVVLTDPMTGKSIYAMTPEGQPLIEPREAPQEPRLTPSQLGAGLTFYSRYLEGVSPVEQARRKKLISDLETQFPAYRGNRGAIGYMLMGGMRGVPEDGSNSDNPVDTFRRLGLINPNRN